MLNSSISNKHFHIIYFILMVVLFSLCAKNTDFPMTQHFGSQICYESHMQCMCSVALGREAECLALQGQCKCWWSASPCQHLDVKVTLQLLAAESNLPANLKAISLVVASLSVFWWKCVGGWVSIYTEGWPSFHYVDRSNPGTATFTKQLKWPKFDLFDLVWLRSDFFPCKCEQSKYFF